MKKKFIVHAVCFILAFVMFIPLNLNVQAAPTGTVTIYCSVIGASVSGDLNGSINSLGRAGWGNLSYKTYYFSVSASGYQTYYGSITLSSSSASTTVYLTQATPKGTITIYGNVTGASISGDLNGSINSSGYASWGNLSYGTYYFTMSASGYQTYYGSVSLSSSSASTSVSLTPVPQTGTITVYSNVTGASISGSLSGTINSSGYASWGNMNYGSYSFTVSASGYQSQSDSVSLYSSSASKTVNLTPVLQTGTITIYCNVAGAAVTGDLTGSVGSSGNAVWTNKTYGTYSFTVSASGYQPYSGSVTLNSSAASASVTLYQPNGTITIECNIVGATISGGLAGSIDVNGSEIMIKQYGTYNFTISHPSYQSYSGTITLNGATASQRVIMYKSNPYPVKEVDLDILYTTSFINQYTNYGTELYEYATGIKDSFLNTWQIKLMPHISRVYNLPVDSCSHGAHAHCTENNYLCKNDLSSLIHHKNAIKNRIYVENNVSGVFDYRITVSGTWLCRKETQNGIETHTPSNIIVNGITPHGGNNSFLGLLNNATRTKNIRTIQHEISHGYGCSDDEVTHTQPCIHNNEFYARPLYISNIWCDTCIADFNRTKH